MALDETRLALGEPACERIREFRSGDIGSPGVRHLAQYRLAGRIQRHHIGEIHYQALVPRSRAGRVPRLLEFRCPLSGQLARKGETERLRSVMEINIEHTGFSDADILSRVTLDLRTGVPRGTTASTPLRGSGTMVVMRVVLAVALLLVPAFGANANGDPNQTRIARLEKSVLAPCCYTEPVASHQSEIAVKIRLEIANWVQQGMTDREILDTYAQRYGARVLVDPTPPGNWSYLVPWSIAVVGSMVVSWILWRWHLARLARTVSSPDPNGLPDLPNLDDE